MHSNTNIYLYEGHCSRIVSIAVIVNVCVNECVNDAVIKTQYGNMGLLNVMTVTIILISFK